MRFIFDPEKNLLVDFINSSSPLGEKRFDGSCFFPKARNTVKEKNLQYKLLWKRISTDENKLCTGWYLREEKSLRETSQGLETQPCCWCPRQQARSDLLGSYIPPHIFSLAIR